MADREDVIKGLECCASGSCMWCTYFRKDNCLTTLEKDALELLKEPDSVEPRLGEDSNGEDVFRCGSCGTALYHVFPWTKPDAPMKHASYCRKCGRPINWEEVDPDADEG